MSKMTLTQIKTLLFGLSLFSAASTMRTQTQRGSLTARRVRWGAKRVAGRAPHARPARVVPAVFGVTAIRAKLRALPAHTQGPGAVRAVVVERITSTAQQGPPCVRRATLAFTQPETPRTLERRVPHASPDLRVPGPAALPSARAALPSTQAARRAWTVAATRHTAHQPGRPHVRLVWPAALPRAEPPPNAIRAHRALQGVSVRAPRPWCHAATTRATAAPARAPVPSAAVAPSPAAVLPTERHVLPVHRAWEETAVMGRALPSNALPGTIRPPPARTVSLVGPAISTVLRALARAAHAPLVSERRGALVSREPSVLSAQPVRDEEI